MDLNDPRRRLVVARQANPSIRVSVAPPPTSKPQVVVGPAPNVQKNLAVTRGPGPTPQPTALDKVGDFAKRMNDLTYGTAQNAITDSIKNISDSLTLAGAAGNANSNTQKTQLADSQRKWAEADLKAGKINPAQYQDRLAQVNKLYGSANKDIKSQPFMNESREKTASKAAAAVLDVASAPGVEQLITQAAKAGGKIIGKNIAADTTFGVAYGANDTLKNANNDTTAKDYATNSAIGGGITGTLSAIPFFGKYLNKALGGKSSEKAITEIAKSTDAKDIQKTLKSLAGDTLDVNTTKSISDYLVTVDDPTVVREIVESMTVDPRLNISTEVRQQYEDSGIKNVEMADTPYGAEYQDGTVRFKDQSFATDENAYHELGHHIFSTKLTQDEQALFASVNGPARAQAVGRAGYTESDLISEDFSDMLRKALTGKIDEIPEELRPIIQKYAKVAAQEAPSAAVGKTLTDKVVQVVNPQTGKKVFYHIPEDQSSDIIKAIDGTDKGGIAGEQLDGEVSHITARSPEDMAKRGFEDGGVYGDTSKPAQSTEQAVAEGVSKQSGTVESLPAEDVKAIEEAGGKAPDQVGEVVNKNADEAVDTSSLLDKDTTPDEVQAILDAASRAKSSYDAKGKLVSKEKGVRAARAEDAYWAAGGGAEGMKAKMKALGGKYTESDYVPLNLDPATEKSLLDRVANSNLQNWEKTNTQNSLEKIWGANPQKPADYDYNYIRRFFNENYGEGTGDELAKTIKEAIDNGDSIEDVVSNISGLPRALMATGDLSGGFRQAAPLGTRYPKIWAKANVESVKYAVNPKYYESEMKKIADAPDYNVIADKMGVDLTGVGATQDEAFIGAGYAERLNIPQFGKKAEGKTTGERLRDGYGPGQIAQSADRAYTGVLTRMRYDVASKLVKDAGGPEAYIKSMEDLYGDKIVRKGLMSGRTKASDRAMRALGEVINTFTGRGGMKGGKLDVHMKTASSLLFAPRLWAANVNRLNPAWYAKLARDNPQAAKLALQSQGTFMLVAGTVLGVAAAAGAEVGINMGSADFGKIKVDNTRYDILGGQQQNIVQIYRQITGQKVDSATGEVDTLGDGYGAKSRFDLAFDMLENKSNPLLGFGIKLMSLSASDTGNPFVKEDQYGNEFNIPREGSKLLYPLGVQGAEEASDDVGSVGKGIAMNIPSFFGVGVQTYGDQKTKDFAKKEDGTKEYKGKITDDMILSNGKPMLDDKGKPVKVKIPEGASDLEIKALKDDKKKSAKTAEYKRGLSTEDQALLALDEKVLKNYLNDGDIDQEKFDSLMDVKQKIKNLDGVEIDENVKSDNARSFYEKYNSLNEKQKEKWLNSEPTTNSKSIAKSVNEQRSEGLSEFKPSQKLAKLYAEYELDANSHPEYTEIDKRNKAKEFQLKARKLNESNGVNDVYAEGGSKDLKTLLNEGKVSQEDLAAAINMDNELYNSGVTDSLKFSKTFRNTYGYGVPAGPKGSGGSGSTARGSGSSKQGNAHLANFLVNVEGTGTKAVPQFSARARTAGKFKAPAGTKPGNSSSTVSVAPYNTKSVSQLRRSI